MVKKIKENWFFIFCDALILCGILLRLKLLLNPFSYDELFTLATVSREFSFGYIIHKLLLPDVHPPLYNFLMYAYSSLLPNNNEFLFRLPSFLLTLGATLYGWFYFPLKEDKKQKLIFTTLFSVSLLVVYYSADARSYALLLFLSMPLSFSAIALWEKLGHNTALNFKEVCAYGVCCLLACYTHYFGAVLSFSLLIILAARALYTKHNYTKIILCAFIVLLFFAPWLILQLNNNIANINGGWWNSHIPFTVSVTEVLMKLVTNHLSGLLLAGTSVFTLLRLQKKEPVLLSKAYFVVPALALLTMFFWILVFYVKINLFIGRFFIALLPCVLLFFTFFMDYAEKQKKIFVVVNVLILCCMLYTCADKILHFDKDNSGAKAAANYLLNQKNNGAALFYYSGTIPYPACVSDFIFSYYLRKIGGKRAAITKVSLEELGRLEEDNKGSPVVVWLPSCDNQAILETGSISGLEKDGQNCYLLFRTHFNQDNPPEGLWRPVSPNGIENIGEQPLGSFTIKHESSPM